MRTRLVATLAIAMLFGVGTVGWAQQTGNIFGKVTDASGAVMPGVTVVLTGPVLLQPITAVSSETGTYQFPRLNIGSYHVKFELTGFRTIVREGVRVEIGANIQVNATMEISTVEETVTVTGETPIVDLRDTTKGQRFNLEALQSIPSARDPWVILEQTAGITMDRQNVGGSQSGQQSNYMARGAYWNQSKWNLEGVDITDMSALGASPVYYDFDMLEEMQVTTGGSDVSSQTAGVQINLVTKSGTDKFKGSGRMLFTPEALESVNIDDDLRKQGARSGNPIQDIKDLGFEIGGPIKRGRAWFWGSYGKQDIKVGVEGFYKSDAACQEMKATLAKDKTAYAVRDIWGCLMTDLTTLNNYNAKASVQLAQPNRMSIYANFAEKVRNARDASDLRPAESTYRQKAVSSEFGPAFWKTGIPSTYKASDQHVFSDRLMVEAQWAHIANNFTMDFHEDSLAEVQPMYERNNPAGLWGRSGAQNVYIRPIDSIDLSANYFAPGWLGGDHSFKTGYRYRHAVAHSEGRSAGGDVRAEFASPPGAPHTVPYSATVYRRYATEYGLQTQHFWFQDTYSRKNWNLNVGFRWDRQTDEARATGVPANPFYGQATGIHNLETGSVSTGPTFNWMPAISFDGVKSPIVFSDFSPRVGLTYDLLGDGRNVLKASYARYYGQISSGSVSGYFNPMGTASAQFRWIDVNGDTFVQPGEIDMSRLLGYSGFDPANPGDLGALKNIVDPNLKNEKTDEILVSFERQLSPVVAFGASYIYRKYSDFRTSRRYFDENDPAGTLFDDRYYVEKTYDPNTYSSNGCPAGANCPVVTYWEPTVTRPSWQYYYTNEDYYRDYNGFEVTFMKRMANRWMATSSFAYNASRQLYDSVKGWGADPTNFDKYDGKEYAPETGASGIDNVFVGARWSFKLSGVYQLPLYDIGVSGFYQARQGYPVPYVVQTHFNRPNLGGRATINLDDYGSTRLPTYQNIDLRIDKSFTLARVKLNAGIDMFNLFNFNTVLALRRQQNSANANQVSQILAPRVIRFGFRATF